MTESHRKETGRTRTAAGQHPANPVPFGGPERADHQHAAGFPHPVGQMGFFDRPQRGRPYHNSEVPGIMSPGADQAPLDYRGAHGPGSDRPGGGPVRVIRQGDLKGD